MTLTDGEGRGTGRLVLVLKKMPTRVIAEWMAQAGRQAHQEKDWQLPLDVPRPGASPFTSPTIMAPHFSSS